MKTKISTLLLTSLLATGLTTAKPRIFSNRDAVTDQAVSFSSVRILEENDEYSMFAAALKVTGFDQTIQHGAYTILAPSNSAFAKIPRSTMDMLMEEENRDILTLMVSYHIIPGTVDSQNLSSKEAVRKLVLTKSLGSKLGKWDIDGAKIVNPALGSQGTPIHGIDQVLLPEISAL